MTLTVTPEPNHIPPRVRIDLDTDDPATFFSTVAIRRDGQAIRQQPFVGQDRAVAYDYEAPFGSPTTYSADGKIATPTVLRTETWANLTGWTTTSGAPSISGSHLSGGTVRRALAFPASGRLVSQGLKSSGIFSGFAYIQIGPIQLSYSAFTGGRAIYGSPPPLTIPVIGGLDQPFQAVWDPQGLTVTTATQTKVFAPYGPLTATDLEASATGTSTFVEDFVLDGIVVSDFSEVASPATLDVNEAWLIHPTFSSLSCSIDPGQHKFRDEGINVDATTKTNVGRAARSTTHEPPAGRRKIVFTTGPRTAGEWELVLRTRTVVARDQVDAICDDQSPLLLRSPQGWPWDLPDGWYSVGDYSEERTRPRLDSGDRLMTLPMTPVDEPTVRLATAWTYGADLLLHATYADARAAMPTYLDRLVGP